MAANLNFSLPDYSPPHETSTSVELTYIEKPFIPVTDVTVIPIPKPLQSSKTRFPYGYCTYYVSTKVDVQWSGNAGAWLAHAQNDGYTTGKEPAPGAILVTNEGSVGHVALTESINDSDRTFTVSEMNYEGLGIISRRTLSFDDGHIKGFIYTKAI